MRNLFSAIALLTGLVVSSSAFAKAKMPKANCMIEVTRVCKEGKKCKARFLHPKPMKKKWKEARCMKRAKKACKIRSKKISSKTVKVTWGEKSTANICAAQ